ncbi:hypothetical protein IQ254_26075 [Nodosilinea sp. LEGE 07088]|uniref:hypothetical protein n=1 Tax=Nodosilinea sp. LEGE 07088 TaxID=2777968 RepID=UPI00187E2423|nr:hypothetical protein [Nodosilinea sp. LEGE 07088]MBE9140627.1 hypothetical protein [Nodosilinea sp. LEGE 07088]
MSHPNQSSDVESVYQLLDSYSFDINDYSTDTVIASWLEQYGSVWVSHAITEALYQGRYKIVSIDHILQLWQRRGSPIRHFNREFESIILGQALLYPAGYGEGSHDASPVSQAEPDAAVAAAETAPPSIDSAAIAPDSADSAPDSAAIAPDSADSAASSPSSPHDGSGISTPQSSSEKIPNFRPLTPSLDPIWPQADEIRPFVPRQDGSELHQRLQAVVKGGMRE